MYREREREIDIHTYIHTYMHAYIHTYIYTYVRTYTHTYIHTYNSVSTPLPLTRDLFFLLHSAKGGAVETGCSGLYDVIY